MMSKIAAKFTELKKKNEGALIGYLTMGDPDIAASERLIESLCENVDILELGIPFTDPIADGPTIQAAIDRALRAGMNTDIAFEIVERLRKKTSTPFIFMTYYNIILQYGEERFVQRCRETGVDGILISDMPVEESRNMQKLCRKYGVDFISLIAPTTTEERIKKIAANATGFVYLVALLGVTGAREKLQEETIQKTEWALKYVKIPLVVGFGISKKEHVEAVIKTGAGGAVVGSAFVDIVAQKGRESSEELRKLAAELKRGTLR